MNKDSNSITWDSLRSPRPLLCVALGIGLMLATTGLDYIFHIQVVVSAFYLLPVALVGWGAGRVPGIVFSFLGAILWFTSKKISGGLAYSAPAIEYWNACIHLFAFLFISELLSKLQKSLSVETKPQESLQLHSPTPHPDDSVRAGGAIPAPASPSYASDPLIAELRPTFIANVKSACDVILDAVEHKNPDAALLAGHNLHGSGAIFEMPEIADLGAQIEAAAQREDFVALSVLQKELRSALNLLETK